MSTSPEPLSWLVLEQYVLGELDAKTRGVVEAHLGGSPEDRARLESILDDRPELTPLVVPRRPARRPLRALVVLLPMAAAALALLMMRPEPLSDHRLVYDGTKGGEVSIVLVSDRAGEAPRTFALGERFKVLLTCPGWFERPLRTFLFQGTETYEPLPALPTPGCGNHVPWPGAFSVDGAQPVSLCVTWATGTRPRNVAELGDEAVCVILQPRSGPQR